MCSVHRHYAKTRPTCDFAFATFFIVINDPPIYNNIMPSKGSRKSAPATKKTLVLDNGAYTLKAGLISSNPIPAPSYNDCSLIPNCIARSTRDKCTYTASELNSCKDFGELAFRRPVEKGFIVNWEAEKAIWEHEFMGAGEGLRVGMRKSPVSGSARLIAHSVIPKK